jgi:hypothetical protein
MRFRKLCSFTARAASGKRAVRILPHRRDFDAAESQYLIATIRIVERARRGG